MAYAFDFDQFGSGQTGSNDSRRRKSIFNCKRKKLPQLAKLNNECTRKFQVQVQQAQSCKQTLNLIDYFQYTKCCFV